MKTKSSFSSLSTRSPGKPVCKKNGNEAGFSLLEVIVALAILSMGFMTVLQIFSQSIRTVDLSDQYLKGISLANEKISELELTDFNVEDYSGTFKKEDSYRWELKVEPYESPVNKEKQNIRVVQVNLKVLWQDGTQARDLELVTLKTLSASYPATDQLLQGKSKKGSPGGNKNQSSLAAPKTKAGTGKTNPAGGTNVPGSAPAAPQISGAASPAPSISGAP